MDSELDTRHLDDEYRVKTVIEQFKLLIKTIFIWSVDTGLVEET